MPTADVKAATIRSMATRANSEVLDAGRQVVMRSSTRWRRVTDSDPCGFCAMLASRGPVYRSAERAGSGDRWHGHCGCTVEPFEGDPADWEPTPGEQRFIDAYNSVRQPGMSAEETAARMQEWLGGNPLGDAVVRLSDGFEAAPLIKGATSIEDAVGNANPLYSTGAREYMENCSNCSVAFEARMRGYDVTAAPHDAGRNGQAIRLAFRRHSDGENPAINWMAGNGKRGMSAVSKDDAVPVGARGIMAAAWKGGGGHFWNWEKTAAGIRFYDAQPGRVGVLSYLNRVSSGKVGWMRTDDCEFVGDLGEWLRWE